METRILTNLSHWMLEEPALKERWGDLLWREVFEACGSPMEWREFVRSHQGKGILAELKPRYEEIATMVLEDRSYRVRRPVILPDF